MALNIPMPPANFGGGLLQGLVTGRAAKQNKQLMDQNWQKHLQDLAIKQQEQARLEQLFPLQQQLMNAQIQQAMGAAAKSNMLARLYAGDEGYDSGMAGYTQPQSGTGQLSTMGGQYSNPPNQMGISNPGEAPPTNLPPTNEDYSALERQIREAQTNPNFGQRAPLSEYAKGKEVVLNEGDPRKRGLDRIAGAPGFQNVQTNFDTDGNLIKMYPSGRVTMTPVGSSAQEKQQREVTTAQTKERNKQDEKYRAENLQSIEDAQQSLSDIKQANDLLGEPGTEQYDYATSALGPIDSRTPPLRTGTRLFVGEFERLAGRLKSNIARLEKGATSDKERAMIDKAEISRPDPWTVNKGKLLAQEKYMRKLIERKVMIADLMDKGYSRNDAMKISMKQIPLEENKNANENQSSSLEDPLGIRS
jgi:hypothetical protein